MMHGIKSLEDYKILMDSLTLEANRLKPTLNNKTASQLEELMKFAEKILKKKHKRQIDEIVAQRQVADAVMKIECILEEKQFSYENASLFSLPGEQIEVFLQYVDNFTDEEYWKNLGEAYISQYYKQVSLEILKELFSSNRRGKEFLMTDEEQKIFNSLPNQITIYRGGTLAEVDQPSYGISWSLNPQIADKFLNTTKHLSKGNEALISLDVEKKDVIAYFNRREEDEIIYIGNKH